MTALRFGPPQFASDFLRRLRLGCRLFGRLRGGLLCLLGLAPPHARFGGVFAHPEAALVNPDKSCAANPQCDPDFGSDARRPRHMHPRSVICRYNLRRMPTLGKVSWDIAAAFK